MWKQLEANSFLVSWKSKMHKGKQNNNGKLRPVSQRLKCRKTETSKSSPERQDDGIIMHTGNHLGQRVKDRDYNKLTQERPMKTKTNR